MGYQKKYTVDASTPHSYAVGMLTVYIDQLISYRKTTKNPDELEWEIRLYQFMLEDPAVRLDQYSRTRNRNEGSVLSKRQTVKVLGWDVK